MAQSADIVIEVEDLGTRLGDSWVHRHLSLRAYRGEVLTLIGDSGNGKTVLLHQIIGLLKPATGSVRVLGVNVHQLSGEELRGLSRRWGVLFQQGALFSALTVFDNIAFPLRELRKDGRGLPDSDLHRLVRLKLDMVGLKAQDAFKYPSELSGGMVKRAALARAIILDPELLFLDEPTTGLDPAASDDFDSLLLELKDELHFSVFMITHDRSSLAAVSDRIAVLDNGCILSEGTVESVLATDHPYIHRFFRQRAGEKTLNQLVQG